MNFIEKALKHRVFKNTIYLALIQIVNYLFPLVVLVYLTKTLGLELYGVIAFSIGLAQLSNVLLDFGFNLSATQKISIWREKKKLIAYYIGAILIIKTIIFMVIACVIIIYALTTKKYDGYSLLFMLTLIGVLGQGFQPVWFFSGIEKMKLITVSTVSIKLLNLILVLALVNEGSDYLLIPISNGAAQLLGLVICAYQFYRQGYYIKLPKYKHVKFAFISSFSFFLSRLSVAAYGNSSIVILGLLSSPSAVALYTLAEQLYKVMQSFFMPINQALYPYMAKEKNISLLFKAFFYCVLIALLGSCLGYFVTPFLIILIFGADWLGIISTFNVFLIGIVIYIAGVLSGYPLAVALNRPRVANNSVMIASFIYFFVVVVIYLFDGLDPIYLACAVVLAEVYVFLHRAFVLWPLAFTKHVYKF